MDIYTELSKKNTSDFEKSLASERETVKILQEQNVELSKTK